jgi:hypothetical protein
MYGAYSEAASSAHEAATIKDFSAKGTVECKVMELRPAPHSLRLRLAETDEDDSPLTNHFVQYIGQALLITSRHVPDDNDEEHIYYSSNEAAKSAGLATFGSILPPYEVNWDSSEIETSRGLSVFVFQGIGQAYVSAVMKSPQASMLSSKAAYEVDISYLSKYDVRKGYERYGAIAYFNEAKEAIGIWCCHGSKVVMAADSNADNRDEWVHAMATFRSAMCLSVTFKEHLAFTHMIVANSVHLALRETLSPTHPLRRLLKPHCFHVANVNMAASPSLLVVNGLAFHIFGITKNDYLRAFVDCVDSFKFETFPQMVESRQLTTDDCEQLPFIKDGLEYWHLLHEYVSSYLSIFYPGGDNDLRQDAELLSYWSHVTTTGPSLGLGVGGSSLTLSFSTLIDQLVHFIFAVTAGHEFYGSIVEYLVSPNVMPAKLAINKDTSDLQTFHLALALISLTGNRMPSLINDWSHLHSYLLNSKVSIAPQGTRSGKDTEMDMKTRQGIHSRVLTVLETFQKKLVRQSQIIDARNELRGQDASKKSFNACNPRVLECSVSL